LTKRKKRTIEYILPLFFDSDNMCIKKFLKKIIL